MVKSIVFDFDGVVINSHDLQVKALTESYKRVVGEGKPPYEEFFKNSGDSLTNILKKLNLPMEIISHYLEVSTKHMDKITVHGGIEKLLVEFGKQGYNCAICTGKDRERTLIILKYLQLDKYFKGVVCSDDVIHPKPEPESLLKAIEILNGECKNTIMVGDGINDVLCAKRVGVTSIGVSWGDLSREDIMGAQPDYIADTIEELRDAVKDKFRI